MDKIRISTKKKVLTIEMTEEQADSCFDELCQGVLRGLREETLRSAPVNHVVIFDDPVSDRLNEKENIDQSGGGKREPGQA